MSLSPSLGRHFMLLNTMTIVHRAAEPDQPGHGAMASEIGPSVSLLTAPPSSTSASARMHSAEEWEAVRHLITGLYIQERMTLSKVMGILRESHDFVATAKQYKRKLQLWGLNKNVKGSEMKALVRKQQKRKEVGKKTVCRVRGYEIDEARISRYIARKAKQETGSALPGSPEDFGSVETPSEISVHTPRAATPFDPRPSPLDVSETREQIFRWLSPVDQSVNHQQACEQRLPGTGHWLLEDQRFVQWKESPGSLLWLHGIPGCGKTILCSTIIETLRSQSQFDTNSTVAYFYFDYKDRKKQDIANLFRSLIVQLSSQNDLPSRSLMNLYDKYHSGNFPAKLFDLMNSVANMILEHSQVYIVVDALDECMEVPNILDSLSQILAQHNRRLHLLVCSRWQMGIMKTLSQMPIETIAFRKPDLDSDLRAFIQHQLENRPSLSQRPSAVKEEITKVLLERADGMFRWVACQLDSLEKCFSPKAIRSTLKNLPETLDETYARILCDVDESFKKDAIRVLQWLVFSAVPLRIKEVADVLIAKPHSHSTVEIEDRLFDPNQILPYFGSLVSLHEPSRRDFFPDSLVLGSTGMELSLAHFSIREYLVSQDIIQETAANLSIAGTCLTYLFQFANSPSLPIDALDMYPLAGYAAQYWAEHARKVGQAIGSGELDDRVVEFLYHEQLFNNWIRLYNPDAGWEESKVQDQVTVAASPLYYTCLLGLLRPARILLAKGASVNTRGGYYGNPLEAASATGYENIVKILLENGADVNSRNGGYYGSPLQAAAARGRASIVRMLLDHGADANSQGGYYGTALEASSGGGYDQIVLSLLEAGADPNVSGGGYYGTPLQAAADRGHGRIVELLLDKGADVNAQGGYYGTPLQAAAAGGYDDIAMRLIRSGAIIEAQGGSIGHALEVAAARGYEVVVRRLLQAGADANALGGFYGNALQAASAKGYDNIVGILLDYGADINAIGGPYGNAINAASERGHDSIVEGGQVGTCERTRWTLDRQPASGNGKQMVNNMEVIPRRTHYPAR